MYFELPPIQATFLLHDYGKTTFFDFDELFKNSVLNLLLPRQLNKMTTGLKKHTLGRESPTNHCCQIWLNLLHWL